MANENNKRGHATLDDCVSHLHEARELSVYNAIERLVQAAEQVGLSVEDMIQMLDRGATLSALFDLIEERMASHAGSDALTEMQRAA
jgi:hypothetical protein